MEQIMQCPKCKHINEWKKVKEDEAEIVIQCKICGLQMIIIKGATNVKTKS